MKIKPEERPTVIGLGTAIGVVLLFGASRLLPLALNGNKTENTPNDSAVPLTTASAPPTVMPASLQSGITPADSNAPGFMAANRSKVDMYSDTVGEPTTTRDPFAPTVPSAEVEPAFPRPVALARPMPSTSNTMMQTAPVLSVVPSLKPNPPLAGKDAPTATGIMPGNGGNAQSSQMVLAGVIAGPQAVAVIHIGERAYQMIAGEKMPYNMSLTRITDEGVYVKLDKQTWFMQVGKSLSAAILVKPGMGRFKAPASMIPNPSSGPVRRLANAIEAQPANTLPVAPAQGITIAGGEETPDGKEVSITQP